MLSSSGPPADGAPAPRTSREAARAEAGSLDPQLCASGVPHGRHVRLGHGPARIVRPPGPPRGRRPDIAGRGRPAIDETNSQTRAPAAAADALARPRGRPRAASGPCSRPQSHARRLPQQADLRPAQLRTTSTATRYRQVNLNWMYFK